MLRTTLAFFRRNPISLSRRPFGNIISLAFSNPVVDEKLIEETKIKKIALTKEIEKMKKEISEADALLNKLEYPFREKTNALDIMNKMQHIIMSNIRDDNLTLVFKGENYEYYKFLQPVLNHYGIHFTFEKNYSLEQYMKILIPRDLTAWSPYSSAEHPEYDKWLKDFHENLKAAYAYKYEHVIDRSAYSPRR